MSGEDYSKLRRLSEDFQSRFRTQKALLDFPNSVSRALEANGPILRLPQLLWVGGQIAHLESTKRLLDYYSSRPLQSENFDQEGRNITMPSERSCRPFQGNAFLPRSGAKFKNQVRKHHTVNNHPKLRPGSLQYHHQRLPHHIEHSYSTLARIR